MKGYGLNLTEGRPAMSLRAPQDSLFQCVYLSWAVRRGNFFADPAFGRRRRERLKNTERTALLLVADMRECLQWLLDAGRARRVDVRAERDPARMPHAIRLLGEVEDGRGRVVPFDIFEDVV